MNLRVLGKLRVVAGELGAINALLYGLDRVLARHSQALRLFRYRLVVQPVADHASLSSGRGRSIGVRNLLPGDPALAAMPLSPAVLTYRYNQGAVCLGAFKDSALIGYMWLCLGSYLEDEVRCRFVPSPEGRAAWDFDIYVTPEHRIGIAFARLWDTAMAFLHERGIEWSMSRISAFNAHSLGSHRKLGADVVGSATFLRLGRWQLMVANLAPFVHLSSGPDRVPRLFVRNPRQ